MIENELVLLIDGIEQLSDRDCARSDITFLKDIKPHRNSIIIVSCSRIDERIAGVQFPLDTNLDNILHIFLSLDSNAWVHYDSHLRIPTVLIDWNVEKAVDLLEKILRTKNRSLTSYQLEYARKQLKKEPTALCVQLVVRIVESWTSNDVSSKVQEGVRNLMIQILDDLELQHEKAEQAIWRTALGFITFSANGLHEKELTDLLSLHKVIVSDGGADSLIKSLHVSQCIRRAMYGLVMEGENERIVWSNRQLKEVAVDRYRGEEQNLIKTMKSYFGSLRTAR